MLMLVSMDGAATRPAPAVLKPLHLNQFGAWFLEEGNFQVLLCMACRMKQLLALYGRVKNCDPGVVRPDWIQATI